MKADQANNIDLPDLLSRLGHEPVSIQKGGNELWYLSPFRTEKEPSFHISKGRKYAWVWKDFGDEGGTVIDFIMRLQGHRDLKKVLSYLTGFTSNHIKILPSPKRVGKSQSQAPLFSFHGQEAELPLNFSEDRELAFIKAHEIRNPIIYRYLTKQRAIPRPLIDRYLKEVHYHNKKMGKDFFAFGIENRSGGYEIRAASDEYKFKSALTSRDVTFIKGKEPARKSVNIVEGMTDFLSLLAMYNTEELAGDTIIMHSVSSYARTAEIIKGMDFKAIHTFLDNDKSGEKHTQKFKDDFGDKVKNQSSLFEPYQDLNQALVANRVSKGFSR